MSNNTKQKNELLEVLAKSPVIQPACERCGISRSTLYRWKSEDKKFAQAVDKAISEGRVLVSELCESKLINAIKNENLGAIKYWLWANDPRYSNKLELKGAVTVSTQELSPAQEESIRHALLLSEIKEREVKDGK
jgi:hypothetical protein